MRTRQAALAFAGATVVAAVIVGCTSGGSSGGSSASSAGAAHGAVDTVAGPASALGAAPEQANLAPEGLDDPGFSAGSGGSALSSTTSKSILLSDNRSVIRRAELTVGVKKASDVAVQANKAEAIIGTLGGDVFGDNRESGTDASATLTLKVPPASLIKALNQLSALGAEQSRSLSSQDVTTQVADVAARAQSAAASIARLRTLFASATKVSDVIAIESELSSRQADLESLQAQQKTLNTETQLATISFVLTTAKAPVVVTKKHHSTGAAAAFSKGWHHLASGAGWLLTALLTVLPFAILVLLIGVGALWLRRRRLVRLPTPTPDAA